MAGTVIDFIRFAADQVLTVPDQLQLRPYQVILNTLTWSGDRVGVGTLTPSSQQVFNKGTVNPRFRQVSKEEIALSGGILRDQDIVIGPFCFPYDDGLGDTGGYDPLIFTPPASASVEFYINIQGPNFPSGGLQFKKIWDTTDRNVMYRIYLRNVAATLP